MRHLNLQTRQTITASALALIVLVLIDRFVTHIVIGESNLPVLASAALLISSLLVFGPHPDEWK